MKRITLLIVFANCFFAVFSQTSPNIKFGKVDASDLAQKSYSVDTSADAVVLYESGSSKFRGNNKGSVSLEFEIYRRIHVLNKNGYDEATIEIPLYTDGEDDEKIEDLKAVTYNLENGKVVESKLEKNSLFKEKRDKYHIVQKFTLPNVKEGSIFEYQFRVVSRFLFNLRPWAFQGGIPRLWSEYKVALPQFLNYVLISQGNQSFYLKDRNDKTGNFQVEVPRDSGPYGMNMGSERLSISCGITEFRWAMKDMPALKEEAYTSSLANYVSRLEFQLSAYQEPYIPEKVMPDWPDLAKRLLKREDFGMQLDNANDWLSSIVEPIVQGASSQAEKVKRVYYYVRDHFTCTDHSQLYPDQTLRNVFKKKSGGVAEINLLLTAMLRSADITAYPVILSTRDHGFVYGNYPVIGRFNYVIASVRADGNDLLLDASYPFLGFARLNADCYNGQARIIDNAATELDLTADKITESETFLASLVIDKNGKWTGKINDRQGYYESLETRRKINSKGQETFFKEIAKQYDNDVTIENTAADSIDGYESPVTLEYNIQFEKEPADILYVNPLLSEKFKNNPFKSTDRQYPVEIPYKINQTYIFALPVPEGYTVDELPKSMTLKMNESDDAIYSYKIALSTGYINLRCQLQINRTVFQPSEYYTLREFFNRIMAKQNEQIVFKKK